MVSIENIEGIIQSRGASIDRIRKMYSRQDEDKIYSSVIQVLSKRYPSLVSEKDFDLLKSQGRIFLADYTRSFNGEHYYLTNDVSTKWKIVDGKIDETMLHELVHKLTFLKKIITQDDFSKNAPYYEGATELVTQNALGFAKESCVLQKGDKVYTVNLGSDVVYPEQVALLRQINLLLGGDFVEQSILQDSKAFENEMSRQFGEHTYTAFFEKFKDTMNERVDTNQIADAIDKIQNLILENCCIMKFDKAKTEEDYLGFMQMLQDLEQMRLTNSENEREFDKQYKLFYNLAKAKFTEKGYSLEKLEKYKNHKFEEYPKTDVTSGLKKIADDKNSREREDFLFENAYMFEELGDKVLEDNTEGIDFYSGKSGDDEVLVTFVGGEILGSTRRVNTPVSNYITTTKQDDWGGAFVGRIKDNRLGIFKNYNPNVVFKTAKSGSSFHYGHDYNLEDYFIFTDTGVFAILNTGKTVSSLQLQKVPLEEKNEILDYIRSRRETTKYFEKQRKELGEKLGISIYRE